MKHNLIAGLAALITATTILGAEVCASLDGNEVARAQNEGYPGHKSGMAYLMSSYDPNCFDNLSVTP